MGCSEVGTGVPAGSPLSLSSKRLMPRRKYRSTTVWRARVLNSVRSTAKPSSFEASIRFRFRSHASATTWVPAIARTESAEPECVFLIAARG